VARLTDTASAYFAMELKRAEAQVAGFDVGKVDGMTFTEAEARQLSRIQFAMWLPARCALCAHEYDSVDDFIERNPRATPTTPDPDTGFVCDGCWLPAFDAWWKALSPDEPEE